MSTYAIGDIQGCYKPLRQLLKQVNFNANNDSLWCVGDLVNRGPNSLDTLRFLQDLGPACTAVLGNHDLHCLAILEDCAPARGKDTLDALLQAPDAQALANWLRTLPLVHFEALLSSRGKEKLAQNPQPTNFLMLHAGVAPQWTLQQTLDLAAEVTATLQGKNYRDYLSAMYGNQPDFWSDKLQGYERLRVITNYLTRLRFCDEIGTLNLDNKKGLETAPLGFGPWFDFEKVSNKDTHILFGHWAAIEGKTSSNRVHALDTGYVWGRELTLMCVETFQRHCVSAR